MAGVIIARVCAIDSTGADTTLRVRISILSHHHQRQKE
jgi:hypothetical protein